MQFGLGGKFLALVRAMYAQVKSCVRANYGLTCTFKFKRGVRQRFLLSLILFALYMNDLEKDLSYKVKGINLWDQSICSMLYADDLILSFLLNQQVTCKCKLTCSANMLKSGI